MPQLKVLSNGEHIMITTEQLLDTVDQRVIGLFAALRRYRELVPSAKTLDLERTAPNTFSYEVQTDPVRHYRQTWYLNPVLVEFGATTGRWTVDELVANIALRNAVSCFSDAVGLQKLSCKW